MEVNIWGNVKRGFNEKKPYCLCNQQLVRQQHGQDNNRGEVLEGGAPEHNFKIKTKTKTNRKTETKTNTKTVGG